MSALLDMVRDQIAHADLSSIAALEARLHDRLRITREREDPADPVREALSLCHARRSQLAAE